MNPNTTPLPDPQTGGRFKRMPDGALQQTQATEGADGRVRRADREQPATDAAAAAAAPAPDTHAEE